MAKAASQSFPEWVSQNPQFIIFDTKVLTALVVGLTRPDLLGQAPTEDFDRSDLDLMVGLTARFKIIVTPGILTEVNSWLNKSHACEELRQQLARMLPALLEHYRESLELSKDDLFPPLGLTDIGLVEAARSRAALVITTDGRLVARMQPRQLQMLEYRQLKMFRDRL